VSTGPEDNDSLSDILDERGRLLRMAYRILGSAAEAEDVVRETYARWLRLSEQEKAQITEPKGWATRVAGKVCLEKADSGARARTSLPRFVPDTMPISDAQTRVSLDRLTLDDKVSSVLVDALDSLPRGDRLAFVLHDILGRPLQEVAGAVNRTPEQCQSLITAARMQIKDAWKRDVDGRGHDAVIRRLFAAHRAGDLDALVDALDDEVIAVVDPIEGTFLTLDPIVGAADVGRFLLRVVANNDGLVPWLEDVQGELGVVFRRSDKMAAIATFHVLGDKVMTVWLTLNPDNLTLWSGR
jgi:RNA polymerase sigma-70 factor (ECF subfamily)